MRDWLTQIKTLYYLQAEIYARLGDNRRALEMLERAYSLQDLNFNRLRPIHRLMDCAQIRGFWVYWFV